MDDIAFDRLTRLFGASRSRREAARALFGSLLGGALVSLGTEALAAASQITGRSNEPNEEAVGAGGRGSANPGGARSRDKHRGRNRGRGKNKGNGKGKDKKKDTCANSGQLPKRGKPCCDGLAPDSAGRCAEPPPPRCAESCAGCCTAAGACQTRNTDEVCGRRGGLCADCTEFGQECIEGTCRCTQDSCPTGCCDSDRICQIGNHQACGRGGVDCGIESNCTLSDRECVNGSCTCTETSCLGGCCDAGQKTCRRDNDVDACGSDGKTCDDCQPPPERPVSGQICPPLVIDVTCCKDGDDGHGFCSCNGDCCEGECFYEDNGCGEFCCTARGWFVCLDPLDSNNRESDFCCPDEECLCIGQSGRFGSNRRPGR